MADNFNLRINAWLSPMLISVVGIVLWSMFNEIRTDVKSLLKTSAQDQIRIGNLEIRMSNAENVIFREKLFAIKPDEIKIPKREELN